MPNAPPAAQPSNVRNPIPTSSQRNNRGSNVTVPYARIAFNQSLEPLNPTVQGDVVFVKRPTGPEERRFVGQLGGAPNRANEVVSLNQLNAMLADPADTTNFMDITDDPFGVDGPMTPIMNLKTNQAQQGSYQDEYVHTKKWANCKMLSEFDLDGVVINVDDGPTSENTRLASLYNTCIQGFTPIKSCDSRAHSMNRYFIGIFATKGVYQESVGAKPKDVWRFALKPFTERQLRENNAVFYNIDFETLVGAWEVGRIMDTNFTAPSSTRPSMTINVCIKERSYKFLKAMSKDEVAGTKVVKVGKESGIGEWWKEVTQELQTNIKKFADNMFGGTGEYPHEIEYEMFDNAALPQMRVPGTSSADA